MSFLIYAWLAAFFSGLSGVFGKLTSKYAINNIWLFNFLFGLFTVLFIIPAAISNHVALPSSWGNLIMAAIFNTLFLIFYALTIFSLDVSIVGALFNFRTAFAVILGVLILHENLTMTQIILIGVIFIAGMFVSIDEKFSIKSFFRLPILYGILMAFFLALNSIFINKAVADTGYWQTTLFSPLLSQLMICLTIPLFYKEIKSINIKQIGGVASMSLSIAIYSLFANWAFAKNVGLSATIISLPFSMFIAFILSIFWPKLLEKHDLKVYAIRFTAAFIMIAAALKISG